VLVELSFLLSLPEGLRVESIQLQETHLGPLENRLLLLEINVTFYNT
jgi:hypothetical protein